MLLVAVILIWLGRMFLQFARQLKAAHRMPGQRDWVEVTFTSPTGAARALDLALAVYDGRVYWERNGGGVRARV